MIASGKCHRALDIGCGQSSPLSEFRPAVWTAGVDAFEDAVSAARSQKLHDAYLVADVLSVEPAEIVEQLGGQFDLVTMYGVIEHLPKRQGFELLERCEAITKRFLLLETPNGFVPQGPEFGNEHQRHLSGWFATILLDWAMMCLARQDANTFMVTLASLIPYFPGVVAVDAVLAWLLRAKKRYRHAFNLVAIKDVNGVPARLGPAQKD